VAPMFVAPGEWTRARAQGAPDHESGDETRRNIA